MRWLNKNYFGCLWLQCIQKLQIKSTEKNNVTPNLIISVKRNKNSIKLKIKNLRKKFKIKGT